MTSAKNHLFALVVLALVAVATACGSDAGSDLAVRRAQVAEAGTQVMPFDLDQTTHIFTNTETGGIQDVVADDPSDVETIDQIRLHLAEEADKFATGDFSDPEEIHGSTMPGLATLKDRYDEIEIDLTQTAVGATLQYGTQDEDLVAAIHDWFSAQTSDHGSHAEAGH